MSATPDRKALQLARKQLREPKYTPAAGAEPRPLLRALPSGSPGPAQNELENALIHVLELVEVVYGPPRVVHGHGLVARRGLHPGERFTDPLTVEWARCRDAARGREIRGLLDDESERVIKADGYNKGWSLRDLDDDESWRRDSSGPCSLLFCLNESPAHRARVAGEAGDAGEAARMRLQAAQLPHGGEPNVEWRPDSDLSGRRIVVFVTRESFLSLFFGPPPGSVLGRFWVA